MKKLLLVFALAPALAFSQTKSPVVKKSKTVVEKTDSVPQPKQVILILNDTNAYRLYRLLTVSSQWFQHEYGDKMTANELSLHMMLNSSLMNYIAAQDKAWHTAPDTTKNKK